MADRETFKRFWREGILAALLIANLFVWVAVYSDSSRGTLKVYFLDVGQGDAIFIETPNKRQVLIDGGKNKKVVSELGKVMSFGDKTIDIVIATHPDADHIGGLPEVVNRYNVGLFIEPGVEEKNDLNNELHTRLEKKVVQTVLARRGQIINFGDGVTLTILFPNEDVSSLDSNDASIVAKLTYGEHDFLLTGDAGIRTENILLNSIPEMLDVEVLKAGYHGSRTSTSLPFATKVSPLYAVISAGKDNSYGHPHEEVIQILESVGAQILNTAESGAVRFETDGKRLKFR